MDGDADRAVGSLVENSAARIITPKQGTTARQSMRDQKASGAGVSNSRMRAMMRFSNAYGTCLFPGRFRANFRNRSSAELVSSACFGELSPPALA